MSDTRTPPQDLAAERIVLGGLMLTPDPTTLGLLLADVQSLLRPGDFYRPAHQVVFETIVDLAQRHEPADPVSVSAALTRRGDLERIGGAPYLHECTESVPIAAGAGYYAQIVAERAFFRRMIEAGTRIAQLGYEGSGDMDALADLARSTVVEATSTVTDRHGELEHIHDPQAWEGLTDEMEHGSENTENRVPTGFLDLDALLNGGWAPGQLVVVGARPALGKSTLALDLARGAVRAGRHATFFGLEMSNKEMRQRWLAAEAQVPLHSIRAGGEFLQDEEWQRISRARARTRDHHLWLADQCQTVSQIRAACRRYQARTGRLDLVVVDYLQLIPTSSSAENRQVAVADASRALKMLAKELNTVVVMLSQLNRKSEDRLDKRPMVADLRESGAVEQDADVVILLYREDAHDKESPRAGEADFILAKHRNGPTADITVAFQGHYSRFVDMTPG